MKTQRKILGVQGQIAASNLKLQEQNIKAELIAKGIVSERQAELLTTQKLNELVNKETVARRLNVTSLQEYTGAYVEFNGVIGENTEALLDIQEKRAKALSDEYERNLDILIDGADNIKTVNERLFADETLSNEKRKKLLEENRKLLTDSYNEQITTISDFQAKRIQLRVEEGEITQEEADQLKELASVQALQNLQTEDDIKLLQEKIRAL